MGAGEAGGQCADEARESAHDGMGRLQQSAHPAEPRRPADNLIRPLVSLSRTLPPRR